MSSNSIEHLDSTMFESVPGLVYLNLSSNRLSTLPDSAFANLASLRELDLSHNFLRANFKVNNSFLSNSLHSSRTTNITLLLFPSEEKGSNKV